jgi:anti-anti-sigma factor
MVIGIEIKEKFSLVVAEGDLNEEDFEKLSNAIDVLLKKGYRHVVLDMSNVPSMNAKGLGALMNDRGNISFKRGDLKIVGLNSRLLHLFRTMGLESTFDLYPSVAEMMSKTGRLPAIA